MDPDTESKIRELDAEILAILEECIAQGRTKEEINFVFAPLNHPKLKMKTTLNITDIVGGAGESLPRPDFRNSTASLRHYWSSASLRKVIGILFCLLVAGFVLTANEEKITNLRFHALAVMRIALIKVTIKHRPVVLYSKWLLSMLYDISGSSILELDWHVLHAMSR